MRWISWMLGVACMGGCVTRMDGEPEDSPMAQGCAAAEDEDACEGAGACVWLPTVVGSPDSVVCSSEPTGGVCVALPPTTCNPEPAEFCGDGSSAYVRRWSEGVEVDAEFFEVVLIPPELNCAVHELITDFPRACTPIPEDDGVDVDVGNDGGPPYEQVICECACGDS